MDDKIIKIKRSRLHILESQKAMMGLSTPPHILMEIDDIRAELGDKPKKTLTVSACPNCQAPVKMPPKNNINPVGVFAILIDDSVECGYCGSIIVS